MTRFVIGRLLSGLLAVLVVATLTFFLLRLVPGGPFSEERAFEPEIKKAIQAQYHLDKPVWRQYTIYMSGLVRGDFGPSFKYRNRDVADILAETFPVSMYLGLQALLLATILGIAAGTVAAVRRDTPLDRMSMFAATMGISIPSFVLGAFLLLAVAFKFKLLPPALWEGFSYTILPSLTLGLGPAAYLARLTRSSMIEVLEKDYVRTAKAKGLSGARVILKHVMKNSLGPVVTVLGPLTAMLVTGSFIVEHIFSIPGMGKYFITAVTNRDYPLVMGVTIIYATLIVLMNLSVDVAYKFLDPRVRLE